MAVLACWRDPSLPSNFLPTASPSTDSGLDAEERLDSYERFTQQIQKVEFTGWRIETIEIADDLVTLRINRDDVTDDSYLLTLAAACGALLDAPDAPVRMIRVLGRDGTSGWVYENPSNCSALLQAPLATQRLAAAANSRPFVGGLDYSQP